MATITMRDLYEKFKQFEREDATPKINLRLNDASDTDARRQCGIDLPSWITDYPQPPRIYPGPVSPRGEHALMSLHPSHRTIGRWFVSTAEGNCFDFVTEDEWSKLRTVVPIYGERIGERMVIWDRIVDENCPGHGGYREYSVTDADLIRDGYRMPNTTVVSGAEMKIIVPSDGIVRTEKPDPPEWDSPDAKKTADKPADFFPRRIGRIGKISNFG